MGSGASRSGSRNSVRDGSASEPRQPEQNGDVKQPTHAPVSNSSANGTVVPPTSTSNANSGALPKVRAARVKFPPPKPPKSSKDDIFSLSDKKIQEIDKHALMTPRHLLTKRNKDLVAYLLEPAVLDIHKARALYRWLASIDIQRLEYKELPPEGSPADHLLRIKWKVSLHARLYAALCKIADVPCVVVTGMTKNAAYVLGTDADRKKMEAYWNAVYLQGNWFLIDPFWASTRVAAPSKQWNVMETDGDVDKEKDEATPGNGIDWMHEINDFYFLTAPHILAYSHFPDDPKWQLLQDPITIEEFEDMAFFRDTFFRLELSFTEHTPHHCMISATGECLIEFALPPRKSRNYDFRYIFAQENRKDGKKIDYQAADLGKFVKYEKTDVVLTYTLSFPVVGSYKFSVYGLDETVDEEYSLICTYVIKCESCE